MLLGHFSGIISLYDLEKHTYLLVRNFTLNGWQGQELLASHVNCFHYQLYNNSAVNEFGVIQASCHKLLLDATMNLTRFQSS